MSIVTYNGENYVCSSAYKGTDYIRLVDSNGVCIVAFEGVKNFGAFSIVNGTWLTASGPDDCYIATVGDDGAMHKSSHKCCDVATLDNVYTKDQLYTRVQLDKILKESFEVFASTNSDALNADDIRFKVNYTSADSLANSTRLDVTLKVYSPDMSSYECTVACVLGKVTYKSNGGVSRRYYYGTVSFVDVNGVVITQLEVSLDWSTAGTLDLVVDIDYAFIDDSGYKRYTSLDSTRRLSISKVLAYYY